MYKYKERETLRDLHIQSKNASHVRLSYQVGRENQSDVIIEEVRPVLDEQRLSAYYYGFLQMREKKKQKENESKRMAMGENLDRQ